MRNAQIEIDNGPINAKYENQIGNSYSPKYAGNENNILIKWRILTIKNIIPVIIIYLFLFTNDSSLWYLYSLLGKHLKTK